MGLITCSMTSASIFLAKAARVLGVVVLRADYYGIDAMRLAVAILHGDLALAVGAQVRQRAILANLGEALHQAVGQVDGQGHQPVGLVAGEPDHHALVARAGGAAGVGSGAIVASLQRRANAGIDVRRLLAGVADDAAGIPVDTVLDVGIADLQQGLAGDGRRSPGQPAW